MTPAVPGLTAAGTLDAPWQLDGGTATLAPTAGAKPAIGRAQALCTLLAASEANNFPVVDDNGSGLTLVLGKLTISDALLRSPRIVGGEVGTQTPPPPTRYQSRLVWVAVIDPELMSSCPAQPVATSSPSAGQGVGLASSPAAPRLVPYQLLALDAESGTDGIDYEASADEPCTPDQDFGPSVGPLMVTASVPWHLISRDPGGLFATISISVSTCDSFGSGANTSRTDVGLVEFDVTRPIAPCGSQVQRQQILRGPTVADLLPTNLTHAMTGYVDVEPDQGPSESILCEQAAKGTAVAATLATTVSDLRAVSAGESPPGAHPFTAQLASFAPTEAAAWCEDKVASGYSVSAVNPDGNPLIGEVFRFPTFYDLSAGPPTTP
jgi:hypothetical protein